MWSHQLFSQACVLHLAVSILIQCFCRILSANYFTAALMHDGMIDRQLMLVRFIYFSQQGYIMMLEMPRIPLGYGYIIFLVCGFMLNVIVVMCCSLLIVVD